MCVVEGELHSEPLSVSQAVKSGHAYKALAESFQDEMIESDRPLNQLVYVQDAKNGYVLGRIVDLDTKHLTVRLEAPRSGEIKFGFRDVVPAVEDQSKDVNDNCSLMYLNEGTLLHNLRLRYERKKIYTYVANILVSINPYEKMDGLYSSETIEKYRGKSLGTMDPHIFSIADKAYRDMIRNNESQSIIVSGESGAGKTENQKFVLRYLCENWSSSKEAKPIERVILETNPILEAFGNAKTLRNNNSSRFGKFVEIHFSKQHEVVGGYVSHYLLENSRIISQSTDERNYHVFFQLIAGADESLAEKLGLLSPDKFRYLNQGCTQFFGCKKEESLLTSRMSSQCQKGGMLADEMVNDYADFQRLRAALDNIGIKGDSQIELFKLLAGILYLGNVEFEALEDLRGGCVVTPASIGSMEKAAELLNLNPQELFFGLTTRIMQPTRSGSLGTLIQVRLKPNEARAATDALSKAIYSRLFDHIVATINSCIPFGGNSSNYIGVLDIAGFEYFKSNSFEQFLINATNEKLQKFFNDRVLRQEQELYAAEGLNVPRIEYSDNQDCIDLFEGKDGLLDLLHEEMRLPRSSATHFTTAAIQANSKNKRLMTSRTMKEYRDLGEDQCFIIRHFAADVCYQTELFLEKNNNSLHASLESLMESSKNLFINKLFSAETSPLAGTSSVLVKNKLVASTISSKFRTQLQLLVQTLEKTGTHFVRCIKPNTSMSPGQFDGVIILSQLRSAGMKNVLCLMQMGYPSRTSFADLYNVYAKTSSELMARLEPRLFCKAIFNGLGLNDMDYKFGVTKIFFRSGKFAQFDQLLRHDNVEELVQKAQSWLNRIRWKKAQCCVLSCIRIKKIFEARMEAKRLAAEEARRIAEEETRRISELAEKQRLSEEKAQKLVAQQIIEKLAEEGEAKKEAAKMVDQATQSTLHKVISWSYAKLRDTINTETDISLIEACRIEFRRRLNVYRQFKLNNEKYKHAPQ